MFCVDVAVVDIYDVVTQEWSVTAFSEGRALPSVAALNDLVIVGPGITTPSNKIDIYDTVKKTWRASADVPKMTYDRMGASAVAAGNRYYFICGGSGINDFGKQEVRFVQLLCLSFCAAFAAPAVAVTELICSVV